MSVEPTTCNDHCQVLSAVEASAVTAAVEAVNTVKTVETGEMLQGRGDRASSRRKNSRNRSEQTAV